MKVRTSSNIYSTLLLSKDNLKRSLTNFVVFFQANLSDIISVVGMVGSEEEESTDALKYCLSGSRKDLVIWGHEYLRCLAGQIGNEYDKKMEKSEDVD